MSKRVVLGIMMTLLLVSMFSLALNIQPVKAKRTIYIRADGSIDPPDAPISTLDNATYTLTGNIASVADGMWLREITLCWMGQATLFKEQGLMTP